ncbi:MAG: DedA family protein [Candidatus Aenigmarchaeota archaeon]|nr:DedA family protein [Candidatus Aenigmarchaeota archaeon]NIP40526.1 DedA family protein [Candidatus Aenigmarchaeota archaeon]NIQ18371.1 DedA family protein [Candidatus Aenigmarchaeota archaeon]
MPTIFTPLILASQAFVETYGLIGTFIISVFESFIFPVPTAFFVTPATVLGADPFWVAVVATIGSLIGAVIGYAFGYYLGKPVFIRLFKKKNLDKVDRWYQKWGEWIVLIAAAGPIPFKIVTWCSGMFELNFKKYMIFCAIGRTFQFFVAAYVGNLVGPWILGTFL